MTAIDGGARSSAKKTYNIVHVFAISWMLGLAACLFPAECALAEAQHAPLTPTEADREIASLLGTIEFALAQDRTVEVYPLIEMSFAAKSLISSASAEGRRLINDFPARLEKHADQERNGGDPIKTINLTVFAKSFASFIEPKASESAQSDSVKQEVIPPDPPNAPNAAATSLPPATGVVPTPAPPPDSPKESTALKPLGTTAPVAPPATVPSLDLSDTPAPVRLETATPDLPKPPPGLPTSMQRALMERGNVMLNRGDVSAARMLFARAAESGLGIAELRLANTYDPVFLQENNLLGIKPDPVAAEKWYRKAAAMGETEAEQRLKSLNGHGMTDVLSTR
jgi:hypothetical protein